jgi:hypothetical protein
LPGIKKKSFNRKGRKECAKVTKELNFEFFVVHFVSFVVKCLSAPMIIAKVFIFLPTYNLYNNLHSKEQDGLQFPRDRKEVAEALGGK